MKKNLQARKIVGKKLQELADVMKLLGDLEPPEDCHSLLGGFCLR
jgi:hypothetical protein